MNRRLVKTSRLHFEPLESRAMMAVFLDSIPTRQVTEGSLVSLAPATFLDTTPGGSYSASIDWKDGTTPTGGTVTAPTGQSSSLRIRFDYTYDTSGFFASSTRRSALEAAGQLAVSRLADQLTGFQSSGIDQFTASFLHPTTGATLTVPGFGVGFNEFVVFVGARDLPGSNLGQGGPGGGSARQAFFNVASARGQFGWPQADFAPWGGAVSFDNQLPWHFETSAAGLDANENDFVSVATHELMHVLGVSAGVASFERFVAGGQFRGPATTAAYEGTGAPPLDGDNSHFREGVMSGGQEALMDPTINTGTRKLPTPLDWAMLQDIGWDLIPAGRAGEVRASHRYTDNGTFLASVTVSSGSGESDRQTMRVVVTNVAPSMASISNVVIPLGQTFNLTAGFTDPGTSDTHTAVIDWGDGTGDSNATVNQSAKQVTGSRQYARAGTFTVRVGVQDDDGASTIESFTVTVTSGPRGDWQNPRNRLDVTNNNVIDPLDALLVINELNDRVLSDPTTGRLPPAPAGLLAFIDVDGDDILAPVDALLVINGLDSSTSKAALSAATSPPLLQTLAKFSGRNRDDDANTNERRNDVVDRVFGRLVENDGPKSNGAL